MADETRNETPEHEYEEPSLADLEDVAGGLDEQGSCGTGGSCSTGGSSELEPSAS